jgi:hypothetical protein
MAKPQELPATPTSNSHEPERFMTSTPEGGPPFAKLEHRIVYRLVSAEHWIAERTWLPGAGSVGCCDAY